MPELAYVNGEILPIEQAQVPIEDRGYQFGDAVYEVVVSNEGRLFALEKHLDRLERSMSELSFPLFARSQIREAIVTFYERAEIPNALLYLQISRGVAPRMHQFPDKPKPQFVMTLREHEDHYKALRESGILVISTPDIRWGRCDIKTVQLLGNILAKQKALQAQTYDAIFLSDQGIVREATSSNVFIVVDGKAVTHPLTPHILPGITRAALLDICEEIGQPAEERFYSLDELLRADEVFLSGTTTEALGVVGVDGQRIGDGKPGPVTLKLYQALRAKM